MRRSLSISSLGRGTSLRAVPVPSYRAATKTAALTCLIPPASWVMLLVILLISYWLLVIFFLVWLVRGAPEAVVLVSVPRLLVTPATPPLALDIESTVSSLSVVIRGTWPSGSNFSSVRESESKLISAATRTTAWPGPNTASSIPSAFFARYCSRLRRAPSWLLVNPISESLSPLSERTFPRLSTTVTWLACKPSTELATRNRMEFTAAGPSCECPLVRTKTDALGCL